MELANLGWFRCCPRRIVFLRLFRAVSNYARLSMGEPFALWNWNCVVAPGSLSRVRPASTVSREDLRFDFHSDSHVPHLAFQLRNFLRLATGPGFDWGTAHWATGTRLFPTGSKWKTRWARRSNLGTVGTEGGRGDFLSRILVTALQLRVAEFPAKAFGFRCTRYSRCRHQRRFA